ncbi:uncharacterized protein LOC123547112 isoform X2 [Mercenaria mercenaria]|uniref:uncharacterized protein LOC123547112 isoform X2 n=1 Tax=Mercenaria mercenaria TaxID=6596 RepID=UPI00234F327D|nr:uncharacterized protein LOC123547112 isoform X2 [Mercenaria mercenaria]
MDEWDPRKDDFENKTFNSYTKGPGRNLSIKKNYVKGSEKHVQLYVTGIPQEITEDGLESLFGRAGTVVRVKKMMSKKENAEDTFGFVTMGSLSDAERAIAELNNFKINRFTLRVSVSLSREELEKKKQQRQELGMMTARGFDEAFSDSDTSVKDLNKPKMMNGIGGAGAATSAIGAGRGQKLKEITQVSPAGDARPSPSGGARPQAGSYPFNDLTIQVDRDGGRTVPQSNGSVSDLTSLHTPVGRGKPMGRGMYTDNRYDSDVGYGHSRPNRGRGGRSRGYHPRGGHRGRGGYYRDYYDDYDGGYGGYRQPFMGRGMDFHRYAMPAVYDPYMGMMGAPHLLQPAYGQTMNTSMMNTTMQQTPMPQHTPMPQQTPMQHQLPMQQTAMPQQTTHPKQDGEAGKVLRQECSVCGKLGVSRCSKCKVPYCSAACQEKDWLEHRKVCQSVSKEKEASKALDDFDVSVGDELIPQVKKLMEKATGDTIQVTKKSEYSPRPRSDTESSRGQGRKEERRERQSNDERGADRQENDNKSRGRQNEDRRGQRKREDSGQRGKTGDRRSGKKDQDDKACFNCGETTHMRNECPMPNNYKAECYNCHKRGHISRDCPLKEEVQRRNDSSNKSDNRRQKTSPKLNNDEEWDEEPVSPKPVSSQKTSKPVAESTPKNTVIATKKKSLPSPPPKKKLPAANMPLNQEIMAVITEVQDPGHFYIQMALEETAVQFTELMTTMHQTFENSQPDMNSVLQGEIYGVKFSLDGSWNRAQVISVSGDSIMVQFLDFGNKETTKLENIRQLSNDMMKLPAQAVLCALEGIIPMSGQNWNIPDVKNYLQPDIPYHAECKRVVDTAGGKINEVVLKNTDRELVSQKLVSANLAKTLRSTESAAYTSPKAMQARTAGPVSRSERLINAKDIQRFVEKLTVGVEYPLLIADAKTPTDFSIQILDDENIQQFTAFNMKFHEECNRIPETEYRPKAAGEVVASKFSEAEGWYRAEVLELVTGGAKVLYIDYLNSETVTFDMMRKAIPMFATFPAQGISCNLYGVVEPVDGKWPQEIFALYEQLSQTALKGTVKEIKNGVVTMELRELTGEFVNEKIKDILKKNVKKEPQRTAHGKINSGELQRTAHGKINPGELPLDGSKVQAMVTNVSAIDSVYVQEIDDDMEKKRNEMMLALNQSLSQTETREPYEPEEEEYVAAVYAADGTALWYRALVKVKVSENNFMVSFVDYGNEECVRTEAIAPLELRFMSLPAMAIRCQLAGSEGVVDQQTLQNLKSLTDNKMYVKAINYVRGIYKVEMFLVDGTNVNEAFEFCSGKDVSKGATSTSPKVAEVSRFDIAETSLPVDGTKVGAKVVLIDSLASFYFHRLDEEVDQKLMECLKDMQLQYRDDNRVYNGEVGEYVAALYDDGSGAVWYRAKVLHTVGNEVKVSIIDYGNEGFVGKECIRKLEKNFTELPAVAVRCKLNGCTGEEPHEVVEEFLSIQTTTVKVKAIEKKGDRYLVELYLFDPLETSVADCLGLNTEQKVKSPEKTTSDTGNNLSRSPVSNAHSKAPISRQNISVLSDLELPLGEEVHAVTYVIESLRSFYVQKADDETQKNLATMMIELAEACQSKTNAHRASAGEIVAALFVDGGDANWYRGQVLELIDCKQCKVIFVDYGNTETVLFTDIRRLESRFLNFPRMAIHCALAGLGNETESMLQKFKTISNVPMTVLAKSLQNGVYEVEVITSDNKNMNRELGLAFGATAPMSPSTEIVDNLPKAISPAKDRLPKKVSSPPKGERKAVFTQTLAKSRPKGKEFTAVITFVVRPNLFHCQVYDQSMLQDLKFLSETMQLECEAEFDNNVGLRFEVGELCCAKFPVDNNWYRASVLEIFPDNTVKVEYVDFGNQTDVPTSHLRPVTEDYTRLPLLAFRCSLHGVSPVGSSWTKATTEEMSKFQDKQLYGRVVSMNNDVYELDLTDLDTKVNMAEYLISIGLAKADDTDNGGMSEMERLRREKELLQRQLEDMHAKMAAIQKGSK